MKRNTLAHKTGLAAMALTVGLGLAACGSEDSSSAADEPTAEETSSSAPAETESSEPTAEAGAEPFGPGCSAIPTDGAGSFDGMATEPVANAASANPLLKTLVSAVQQAGLVDTLNSAEDITVFAPTDDAFAKIPPKTLKQVLKDKKTLTSILTHHVVPMTLTPEDLEGEHDTLNKDMVSVMGSGEEFTVDAGDGEANVICGNIQTANATVYVVDSVLMPPS